MKPIGILFNELDIKHSNCADNPLDIPILSCQRVARLGMKLAKEVAVSER